MVVGLVVAPSASTAFIWYFFFSHFSFHTQTHSESSVCVCVFQLFAPRSHMLGIFRKRKWALLAFSVSRNHFICEHFDFGIIMFL